jgi:hypothetical protein
MRHVLVGWGKKGALLQEKISQAQWSHQKQSVTPFKGPRFARVKSVRGAFF